MVVVAALTASRRTRSIFIGNAWGCGVALVMSPVCIKLFGAPGAIVSMIVTYVVVTSFFVYAYARLSRAAAEEEAARVAARPDVAAEALS
jgi:O-antigen/teichoic acid export membrane protein